MRYSMKLGTKILIILSIVAIGSVAIYGYIGFVTASKSMEKDSFDKLTAVREMKGSQVEDYFKTIKDQITTFSEDTMIVDAMKEFSGAFDAVGRDLKITDSDLNDLDEKLKAYYENEFFPRLEKNVDFIPKLESYLPKKTNTRILQDLYIADNSNSTGSKHLLDRAKDKSAYSKIHGKYHPIIRNFLDKFGYYDIFLVEPETGHIVYTVFKEVDYGTSLLTGPYKDTNFAEAFRQALKADKGEYVILEDYKPYHPSYNAEASFIASPIFDGDKKVGVLLFQMPIDKINDIMTSKHKWSDVGLGETGESYIVGSDYKLRNQSRFLIEDSDNYFKMIEEIGTDPKIIKQIKNLNSTIGLQEVRTKGTEAALAGEVETEIFSDYRGVPVLSSYKPLDIDDVKWVLMSEIDEAEAFAQVYSFRNKILIWFSIFIFAIIIISFLFARSITKRINILTKYARTLSKHDFAEDDRLEEPKELALIASHGDEVGQLTEAFAKLGKDLQVSIDNLKRTMTLKERMETELNVGRDIQMSMLPLLFPAYPDSQEFAIYSMLKPAREVGGDFYDYYFIDDKHFCICVGDVSGKGVPAALYMAVSKTLMKSKAGTMCSPACILSSVNTELSADNPANMFVTVFLAVLNIETGELVYTNAGHNPPLLKGKEGVIKVEDIHGPIVGVKEGIEYGESKIKMSRGDILLMFTDGVTEAMNVRDELYSDERLVELLRQMKYESAENVVGAVLQDVERYAGEADQADDITILSTQYLGRSKQEAVHKFEVTIKNRLSEIESVVKGFTEFTEKHEVPDDFRRKISITLDELLNNIISYGYDDEGEHDIEICFDLHEDRLSITVTDDGVPFNPFNQAEPDTEAAAGERQIGGLGIHIVRSIVEKVGYKRSGEKNIVTLVKYLNLGSE